MPLFPSRRTRACASVIRVTRGAATSLSLAGVLSFAPASARLLRAQSLASPVSSHADSFRCLDTAARAVPARLDDKHGIYVEQETIVAQRDGRVLVAGNPVFVWRDRGDGFDLLARDSLFGMVIDTGAFVRAIPSPLPGHVLDGMRAAALPNGRWLVSFFEVIPMPPEQAPIAKALWVGETDGITWRDLHQLPLVADSMDIRFLSPLAWKNGRARLAVPFVRDHHRLIALYSLDSSRWTTSVHDVGLLAYVAVALSETRDVMAVVKAAADTVVDVNSLFLYSKNPTDSVWSGGIRVLHAGVDPVRDPIFAADARLLAWRRLRVRERSKEAWFTAVDDEGGPIASPVRIAVGAES